MSFVFWFAHSFQTKVEGHRQQCRGHFQCLLLENFVFWYCSLLIGSASSVECNPSGCGIVLLDYVTSIFLMLCDDQKCSPTQDRKGGKIQKFESSLICVVIAEGSTNALPVFTSILAHFCIPVSLHNNNVRLRCLINDILWLALEFSCFVVIIV